MGSKTIQKVWPTKRAADFMIAILSAIVPRLNSKISVTIPAMMKNDILA